MPMVAGSTRLSAPIQSRHMAELPSTTTGSGYAKRARTRAARACFTSVLLEFFADQAIDRVGAATAQSNGECDDAQEKHVLVAALADRETFHPMGREHCDQ